MKNIYFKFILISLSTVTFSFAAQAAKTLNLDVSDQNFNSTDKIVIDQDEIQKSRANNLPTLLATKANISISTTNIQPNSIYIRGGDSSHVLILVDGVPMYDSSTTQRTMNLFGVNLSKIRRIEVLKGSQSVIYGGQALSGVIKIETFADDDKDATSVIAETAAGKFNSNKNTLTVDSLKNITDQVVVTANAYGLSAKAASPVLDSDKLYPDQTGSLDMGLRLKGEVENIFKVNYSRDFNTISNGNFVTYKPIDADDYFANTSMVGGTWILRKADVFSFSLTHQKSNRTFQQEASLAPTGTPTDNVYEGLLTNARFDVNLLKTDTVNLQAGLQYTQESMNSAINSVDDPEHEAQYEGVYMKSDFLIPHNFLVEYGVRQENAKGRALASSYHVGVVWNKLIKFEYSKGFKTPSLFQLFARPYGDANLQAETAKNFSISIERQFNDQYFTSLTIFDTQFENLIQFLPAPVSKYSNVAKTRTMGIESQTSANYFDGRLRLSLALGYQEPRDITANRWLVRRPLQTASLKSSSDLTDDLNVGAEIVHTGQKLDFAGTKYLFVEDYTLINIFGNYRISEMTSVFARVDNLGNKDYETSYSYYNQGALYKVGAQLNF